MTEPLFLVIVFKSSSALAAAYGIAAMGTMVVTAILAFLGCGVARAWKFDVMRTSFFLSRGALRTVCHTVPIAQTLAVHRVS